MDTVILGGGIAGLALAHFLDRPTIILEKERRIGGLARSFELNNIAYDIGPHIIFSKHQDVLDLHTSLIETSKIRRSNKIFHKGTYVKYPFENGLSALDDEDRNYCLKEFLDNPYEHYPAGNMLQFFLKTFGEGITRLYLQPYNQKIWKFDPSCLDLQMVERIPRPPREDVIRSAQGAETEGYTHQLYFHYPKEGGFQTLIDAYARLVSRKSEIIPSAPIRHIARKAGSWEIQTERGSFRCQQILNCMPLHELFGCLEAPEEVRRVAGRLKYNSIHIVVVQTRKDTLGDNFAVYYADPGILFHRLSKLNFLGDSYCLPGGGATFMAEITFRPGSYLQTLGPEQIKERVVADLEKVGVARREDVLAVELKTFKYAYVIYDLDHRKNTDFVLNYLAEQGIRCCGRFAEFEYLNSDGVVDHARRLANLLNKEAA